MATRVDDVVGKAIEAGERYMRDQFRKLETDLIAAGAEPEQIDRILAELKAEDATRRTRAAANLRAMIGPIIEREGLS